MMGRELVDWGDGERTSYLVPSESSNTAVAESGGVHLGAGETAAASIEASVPDPGHLNAAVAGLPVSLKQKMAETLSISPMKGGAKAAEKAFLSRLDEEEFSAYSAWCESLTAEERQAIVSWFDGAYR